MKREKEVNIGGINGLGEGLINLNSKEFKELQSIDLFCLTINELG